MKKLVIFILLAFIIFSFSSVVSATALVPLTKQIGQGSSGPSVVALQNFLVTKGYLTGLVDGKFGPKTKAGVIKYQSANKISPTGFVGPLTLAYINQMITAASISGSNTGATKPLAISSPSVLPTGQVGLNYNYNIEATGGDSGYNWELTSGSLPPGVTMTKIAIRCIKAPCFNWSPALITGTPTAAGNYTFTMQVFSGDVSVSKNFTLNISDTSTTTNITNTGGNPVLCEYARPPVGFHYENIHKYEPCGADLVAD